MLTYPLVSQSQKEETRVVTLEFDTGDTVKFTSRRRQEPKSKDFSFSISDTRSFRGMRSSINELIHTSELSSELYRMLTPDDASIAFDFLMSRKEKELVK